MMNYGVVGNLRLDHVHSLEMYHLRHAVLLISYIHMLRTKLSTSVGVATPRSKRFCLPSDQRHPVSGTDKMSASGGAWKLYC